MRSETLEAARAELHARAEYLKARRAYDQMLAALEPVREAMDAAHGAWGRAGIALAEALAKDDDL